MKRRRLSKAERVECFRSNDGVCHMCKMPIKIGEAWDISHETPLALGGEDGGKNLKPAHLKCHKVETATKDLPRIAKAKRQEAAHIGAAPPPQRPIESRNDLKRDKPKKEWPNPFPGLGPPGIARRFR